MVNIRKARLNDIVLKSTDSYGPVRIYNIRPVFNPRPLRPKGYYRHLRLSVCPSVRLSVCLFPSSLLTQ